MLSCEYCENFKNTYLEEHLQTAASRKSFGNFIVIDTYFIFQGIGQNLDRNELDQGIVRHSEEHLESTQTSKI